MVLEWTPEEASLLQDGPFSAAAPRKTSMGDSEPPDIFQYFRTRKQETLYETCVCVIHTNLQLHYSTMRHSTIDLSLLHLKRASEPPAFFLLGTQALRDRVLHEI